MDIWLVNSFRTGKTQVLLGLCRIVRSGGSTPGMWPPLWGLVYQNFTVAALLLKLHTANFSPIKSAGDPCVAKHTL